jgi:membrane-associated phospholipid phosphatase
MKFLTDFGDSAVLIPLSVVMLIWLLTMRPLAAAIAWAGALFFLGAVLGGLKILFFACPPTAEINSPSGHTGFSLVVYGGLAVIIAAQQRALWLRAAIMLAAFAFVTAIAISRVTLEMHTTPETVIGFAVGVAALVIFGGGYPRAATGRRRVAALLIGAIATIAVFHGSRLTPENNLHAVSGWLGLQRLFCPR